MYIYIELMYRLHALQSSWLAHGLLVGPYMTCSQVGNISVRTSSGLGRIAGRLVLVGTIPEVRVRVPCRISNELGSLNGSSRSGLHSWGGGHSLESSCGHSRCSAWSSFYRRRTAGWGSLEDRQLLCLLWLLLTKESCLGEGTSCLLLKSTLLLRLSPRCSWLLENRLLLSRRRPRDRRSCVAGLEVLEGRLSETGGSGGSFGRCRSSHRLHTLGKSYRCSRSDFILNGSGDWRRKSLLCRLAQFVPLEGSEVPVWVVYVGNSSIS